VVLPTSGYDRQGGWFRRRGSRAGSDRRNAGTGQVDPLQLGGTPASTRSEAPGPAISQFGIGLVRVGHSSSAWLIVTNAAAGLAILSRVLAAIGPMRRNLA
jgi:hypothetical protein